MIPFTLTERSINLLVDGRMRTLDSGHANFQAVVDAVKKINKGEAVFTAVGGAQAFMDKLRDMLDIRSFVARVSEGRVQISDNAIQFDGQEIRESIVDRILSQLKAGFDVRPMARFLEKTKNNPNPSVGNDLFDWLENAKLPICEDGDFIAFKKVNDDFKSYHDRNYDHAIGNVVSMPRNECDENRENTCSTGLHFCAFEYLNGYHGNSGHVVIVKISPTDVTAIPTDYNLSKGRCCIYSVIGEVPEDEAKRFFDNKEVLTSWGTYEGEEENGVEEEWDNDDEEAIDDETCGVEGCNCHLIEDESVVIPDFALIKFNPSSAEIFINANNASGLATSFIWRDTPQGYDFWSTLCHKGTNVEEAQKIVKAWLTAYKAQLSLTEADKATTAFRDAEIDVLGAELAAERRAEYTPKKDEVFKTNDGRKFKASRLRKLLDKWSERKVAKKLDVARSTLQGWRTKL